MTTTPGRPDAVPVRRTDDDELLGLLLPATDDRWVPATVFGAELGPATDRGAAETQVHAEGLSSLADRWWVRRDGGDWQPAWLLEVKADRLRLRWDDPMLMRPGHGEWVRLDEADVRRHPG